MSGAQDGAFNAPTNRDFTVVSQKLELQVDFATQALKGSTDIIILPQSKDLRTIRLNSRQCRITYLTVNGKAATLKQQDPYVAAKPHPSFDVHQHHLLRTKVEPQLRVPPEEELNIVLPKSLLIKEDPFSSTAADGIGKIKLIGSAIVAAETPLTAAVSEHGKQFETLHIIIRWEVKEARDGLQWIGFQDGDTRYPHVYTRNSDFPGTACSIFPCVDDTAIRCPWEILIKVPRTLGNAFRTNASSPKSTVESLPHITASGTSPSETVDDGIGFSEWEKAMEISVICSGSMEEAEISYLDDPGRKGVQFVAESAVSANQIGFAIGPFEAVELSAYREIDDDEKLGAQAIRVHGFCLPGRADEVRNTCMPLAKALDFFTTTYTAYPSSSYKICFVDDLEADTVTTLGLCICSTRLLFPEDIIKPLDVVTRKLIRALAEQYAGISLAPRESSDKWVIAGMASFMADVFMKHLSGNNEYRFQQKMRSDQVHNLDVERPALYNLGSILHLDPSEAEFLALKAGVVLFILDRRLTKSSGSSGLGRIIGRMLTNAKAADVDSTMISTAQFQRQCEKMGHIKLDTFFQQWVYGAGCPTFYVTQRFNKKKLVIEMMIRQVQAERENTLRDLDPGTFLRDIKEDVNEVYAGTVQPVFTGPMTIRIHEADGTPYEHIADIKDANTRFEIPYNTKYKRLKRNKRQRDRVNADSGMEDNVEVQDDVLLYCLGDVLQTREEVSDWRLTDWSKEDEDRMGQESYEWIRMDADFEWICKMSISMPPYMFVSQLQQDRDVVAQIETLQYMSAQKEHPLISTILTRTIMDRRYFHGVRTMAVTGLVKCAKDELDWIGLFHLEKIFQELFCFPESPITRPNDFSDRTTFIMQCAIPQAIAQVKNNSGHAPMRVQKFFFDKLKFNDNSENEFSDVHYVATLMLGLAESLAGQNEFNDDDFDEDDYVARKDAINEIERYRRIDEWVSSYQNIYTATALHCLQRLAEARAVQPRLRDFLQYTRPGNADALRITAIDCLTELGMLRNNAIFKYFLYILSTDPSPYLRKSVYQIFGRGLARLAMGEKKQDNTTQVMDSLIIEQDTSTESRQADLARRQTIPGAVAALKAELGENKVIKEAFWAAVSSPVISLTEMSDLLELCAILYEPKTSLLVTLKLPRYWRVEHIGKAVMRFTHSSRIRITKYVPYTWPTAVTTSTPVKLSLSQSAAAATASMPKPPKPPPVPSRKPSLIVLNPAAHSSITSNGASSATSLHPPAPSQKPSAVTKPSPPPTPNQPRLIVKLKPKGPLPPNTPARPQPSPSLILDTPTKIATKGNFTATSPATHAPLGFGPIHNVGHGVIRLKTPTSASAKSPSPVHSRASTPATSHAMSPPPVPLSRTSSSQQKPPRKNGVTTGSSTQTSAATSKKRKNSASSAGSSASNPALIRSQNASSKKTTADKIANGNGVGEGAAQPPVAKKPMLKLKLHGFGGGASASASASASGGGGGSAAGSPPAASGAGLG